MKKLFILITTFFLLTIIIQPHSADAATDLTKDPNYKIIYTAMVNLEPTVQVEYNSKVFDVLNKVLENHPEIFYIDFGNTVLCSNGKLEIGYNGSTKTIKAQKAQLQKKIDTVYKGSKSKKTNRDKIKYFHDYIVDHTKYDYNNYLKGTIPTSSYNAYGVFVKGVAVCQGYAEAMKILLNKAKIPNDLVVGDANSSGTWIGHAWNLVKVGNKYYHVDATWDDPITSNGKQMKTYHYFMINDKKIQKDHRWDYRLYPEAK